MRSYLPLALAITCVLAACTTEKTQQPANPGPIVLISVDTLRADHLPAWGYSGVSTPNIDSLAAESIVFENAYSHVPLTLPSHISILTGLLPQEHGVRNNVGYMWNTTDHPPITRALSNAGYVTAGAVSAYVLRGNTGLADAFDSFDDAIASQTGVSTGSLQRPGAETIRIAKEWISAHKGQRFFYMLHLFEPHSPWEPPEPFATRYASQPYDGEIAATDVLIGDFIRFLKDQGLYDRSTIVFLSDHGEGLGDHGEQEHGIFLYRESIHVPLMIKPPHGEGTKRVSYPVQLIDVAPTILQLAGVSQHEPLEGVSLIGSPIPPDRRIYSETLFPRVHLGWSELRSLVDARYHYIEAPLPELYDLHTDQKERDNVLDTTRRVYTSMLEHMDEIGRESASPSSVSPEEAAKLAALGYIGTVKDVSGSDLPDPKLHIEDFERLKTAGSLASSGRQTEAIEIYKQILKGNPRFADAWSLLATTYERMGLFEEAIDAYKQGIVNAPVLADEMALSAAGVLLRIGRLDEATSHAELALDSAPAAANQILARIAIARGEFHLAEELAMKAMDDPTLRPRSSVIIAQSRAKQGNVDEALEILLRARAEATETRMKVEYLEFAIGDLYATQEKWNEAESALLNEISAFPWNLQAYANLAVVYVLSGQPDKVDPILARMFEANPTRNACMTAARTFRALGDEHSARLWAKRAERTR